VSISFAHLEYDPSQFTAKQRRDIERQIDGRPRQVKKTSPLHKACLDQIAHELAVISPTSRGRRAFDAFRFDLVTEFTCSNLVELATKLRCGPEGEFPSVGFLWLLHEAHERPEYALAVLVALRPALERILTFLDPSGRDEDAGADLLAAFYGLLPIENYEPRVFLLELQKTARRDVRHRATLRERDAQCDGELDLNVSGTDDDFGHDLERLVDRLVRDGVVSIEDAELVVRSLADNEGLRDLALERGVPYKTLQSQRLRCENVIRGYLRRERAL
jgi:hypothetical protein